MNDPRRLLDEGGSGFESTLLRAGRKDSPGAHQRKQIAAALGVGSVFAASTVATGASATGKGWLGLATAGAFRVTAGVVAGALAIYGGTRALAPHAEVTSGKAVAPVSRPAPPSQPREIAVPTAPPPVTVATSEPAQRRAAPSSGSDTLSLELAALDQARRAVAAGDFAAALGRLDDYSRRFPKQHLGSEAAVLRIETLVKSGDTAQAARLGKDFLARHPNSPYAKRVSSLIGDARATAVGP